MLPIGIDEWLEQGRKYKYLDYIRKQDMEKEIVICSAIYLIEGLIIRGHRHSDCYRNLEIRSGRRISNHGKEIIEGFITSKNRFVDRKEARLIQEEAGIKSVSKDGYHGDILFSEDLY